MMPIGTIETSMSTARLPSRPRSPCRVRDCWRRFMCVDTRIPTKATTKTVAATTTTTTTVSEAALREAAMCTWWPSARGSCSISCRQGRAASARYASANQRRRPQAPTILGLWRRTTSSRLTSPRTPNSYASTCAGACLSPRRSRTRVSHDSSRSRSVSFVASCPTAAVSVARRSLSSVCRTWWRAASWCASRAAHRCSSFSRSHSTGGSTTTSAPPQPHPQPATKMPMNATPRTRENSRPPMRLCATSSGTFRACGNSKSGSTVTTPGGTPGGTRFRDSGRRDCES